MTMKLSLLTSLLFFGKALDNAQAVEDLLVPFVWSNDGNAEECCGFTGYDHCGILEFCERPGSPDQYGYRQAGDSSSPCLTPGPLIRVVAGTKYLLTLQNTVSSSSTVVTNVHTHGLHITGNGNGDDVTRTVSTGQSLHYSWDIPASHDGGTYWYHAHKHGVTALQVGQGALGMLIVEDKTDLVPTTLSSTERNNIYGFLQNEKTVMAAKIDGSWAGNGNPDGAVMEIKKNEWTRIRIAVSDPGGGRGDIAVEPKSNKDSDCEAWVIANDGVYSSVVPRFHITGSSHTTTGASRVDLAVRCNNNQGGIISYSGKDVVQLEYVVGTANTAITPFAVGDQTWAPNRPYYLQDLTNASPDQSFAFSLSASQINGESWNPDMPLLTANFDAVQHWEISGARAHPFHLHLYHMQVVNDCGHHAAGEWYDTLADNCVVRFRTADVGGRCVFHCHVLSHEDNGAMHWMNVTGFGTPTEKTTNPPVNATDGGTCAGSSSCTPTDCILSGNAECGTGTDDCGDACTFGCSAGEVCDAGTCVCDPAGSCTLSGSDVCGSGTNDCGGACTVGCGANEECVSGACEPVTSCDATVCTADGINECGIGTNDCGDACEVTCPNNQECVSGTCQELDTCISEGLACNKNPDCCSNR